jgi:hypothetical protein
MDGASDRSNDLAITFEAKLYTGKLDKDSVQSKITELAASPMSPDVWVLGATVEVGSQLETTIRASAARFGLNILLLDWTDTNDFSPLAVACAAANAVAVAFLRQHITENDVVDAAEAALEVLRTRDRFPSFAADIRRALTTASLGLANARVANSVWLETAFSDRARARALFGQALTPAAHGSVPLQPRDNLVAQINAHMNARTQRQIVCILGGEGFGKSWLVAQSWQQQETVRQLLLMVPANEIKPTSSFGDIRQLLINQFIRQTGEMEDSVLRNRWERHLKSWEAYGLERTPRFVVCVDGLNQQPSVPWAQWLDAAADTIERLGGMLMVTVRQGYFDLRLRNAINTSTALVQVPVWDDQEQSSILDSRGIEAASLNPTVRERLRNPRLMGIALGLLGAEEVLQINELSVERLLFEHIRQGERDGNAEEPVDDFRRRLAEHASVVLKRAASEENDDLLVFDRWGAPERYLLEPDLQAVISEHYFTTLSEDPTRYSIEPGSGLNLALGIAVFQNLQKAVRSKRDVAEALRGQVEPIEALDRTADAIFAALTIASVDPACPPEIASALIAEFLRLQNIDPQTYPSFVGVVRKATEAAALAVRDLATTQSHVAAHINWLISALRESRSDPTSWDILSRHVSNWLRSYTLDAGVSVWRVPGQADAAKIEAEIANKQQKLDHRLGAMSSAELSFLEKGMMRCDAFDPNDLFSCSLQLIAGKPLESFANSFVACAFSMALNSGYRVASKELIALLRFNNTDWATTRAAVLNAAHFFVSSETSPSGQWAMVTLLRALCTADDADLERELVAELTKDRERFSGSRMVEDFCDSDPCDPTSERPQNIANAIHIYQEIDVEKVAEGIWQRSEDIFLREALPSLARFEPNEALAVHRNIALAFIKRNNPELSRCLYWLLPHTAMLGEQLVAELLQMTLSLSRDACGEVCDNEALSRTVQASIQLIFPHLEGNSQLEVMELLQIHGPILLAFANVVGPADSDRLDQVLKSAIEAADENMLVMTLMFARWSGTVLRADTLSMVANLFSDHRSVVRSLAFSIIHQSKDLEFTQRFVDMGWTARPILGKENYFEVWYGSLLLIKAAEHHLLSVDAMIDRISPRFFGFAAEKLDDRDKARIATRLRVACQRALDFSIETEPPNAELNTVPDKRGFPALYDLSAPERDPGPEAFFNRINEADEQFHLHQLERSNAFEQFSASLSSAEAWLLIESVSASAVDAWVLVEPQSCLALATEILRLEGFKVSQINNFALLLARSLSRDFPDEAEKLFRHLAGKKSIVRMVSGLSSLPLESTCIWTSADSSRIDALQTERLNSAGNDFALAAEVLAALQAGKAGFLDGYIQNALSKPEPVATARALMVAGFGLDSAENDLLITQFADAKGLIGSAAKAARFAFDRNRWARHWYDAMLRSKSGEEFWAASILFLKVVDGRYELWEGAAPETGSIAARFMSSLDDRLKSRTKLWKSKRETKLFGEDAPGVIFLVPD